MKKIIFILSIITMTCTILKSQHCGWDHSYIIIVDVRDKSTGEIINGLDIVIVDSTGKPYMNQWYYKDYYKHVSFIPNTDTLKFGQNIKKYKKFSEVDGPFPFGINYYMLIVDDGTYPSLNKNGKDRIFIKDIDGENNFGYFGTTDIEFDRKNIVTLCTGNSIWTYEESVNKVKIKVELKRKQ